MPKIITSMARHVSIERQWKSIDEILCSVGILTAKAVRATIPVRVASQRVRFCTSQDQLKEEPFT